jgi:hypothetical protein
MLNFFYLRSYRLNVLHFWLDSCIVIKGGEVWACFGLLDAFRRFSGGFDPFLGSVAHRSDQSGSPVWPAGVLVLCTCWAPIWPVVVTGLIGQSWADAVALFSSSGLHAVVQGELHWFTGSLHVCRGRALCGFLWRPRFLINPNHRSTWPTVVKPRSTWVLTSKNSPTNSNDPFGLVDTHVGPTHGQSLCQTPLQP